MNSLIENARKLVELQKNDLERTEIEHRLIEVLTFSRFEEIVELLDKIDRDYWIEFPVWARNLAYRLACLLEPHDPAIRRRASADLFSFGPDWDLEAEKLLKEAEELEQAKR